jgi:hypothetical protein
MPGEDLSLEGNDLALASNGLEVLRNSARGTALCFWDSPLLVGARARQNSLPIWRLNAPVPGSPSAPAAATSTLCALPVNLPASTG